MMRFCKLQLSIGLGLAVCFAAAPAAAVIDVVGRTSARFRWAPSTGPVAVYLIFVSRNGGPLTSYALRHYDDTSITIQGAVGDTVQVAVQARTLSPAAQSEVSPPSELVRFVAAAPPPPPEEPPAEEPPAEEPPVEEPPAEEPPDEEPPAEEPPDQEPGDAARVLDFDGDGRADLLLRDSWSQRFGLWFVDTDSVEDAGPGLGSAAEGQTVVGNGDYDGDGQADMLLANPTAGTLELRFLEAGAVVRVKTMSYYTRFSVVGSGDFDGDGTDDVALRKDQEVRVWTRLGETQHTMSAVSGLSRSAAVLGTGDHDGDGDADLLAQAWDNVWILHVENGQIVAETLLGKIRTKTERVEAVCDVDGDLADDAIVVTDAGSIDALLAGGGTPQRVQVLANQVAGSLFATGDYDGDGTCDLALRDPNSGVVKLVFLESAEVTGEAVVGTLAKRWSHTGVGREAP
jgi:hypothetical protein